MKMIKKICVVALLGFFGLTGSASAEMSVLQSSDFVGTTFWVASMGMIAATAFFFVERGTVAPAWKTSMTVAGLVTGIAFIHYMYMRNVWVQTDNVPAVYRYIEWIITLPLQIIQFYLILVAVRKVKNIIFWKLLSASLIIVIFWYLGEAGHIHPFLAFIVGAGGWIYVLYEIFSGELSRLALNSGNKAVVAAFGAMRMIVTVGWAIYPLTYIFGSLTSGIDTSTLNVVYNLADFVNKIVFGLFIWKAAMSNTSLSRSRRY